MGKLYRKHSDQFKRARNGESTEGISRREELRWLREDKPPAE
jgi:hypothetical protein